MAAEFQLLFVSAVAGKEFPAPPLLEAGFWVKCRILGPRQFLCLYTLFFFLKVTPKSYGGSQARGLMGVAAASLCHSNAESELHL